MENNRPEISVLIPVYNTEEKHLRECIESILNQTFKDFELIILNDGSSNNVEDVIKTYNDKRILYYKNEKTEGITKSRNKKCIKKENLKVKNEILEYLTSNDKDKKLLYTLFKKNKISVFDKVKAAIFIFLYY